MFFSFRSLFVYKLLPDSTVGKIGRVDKTNTWDLHSVEVMIYTCRRSFAIIQNFYQQQQSKIIYSCVFALCYFLYFSFISNRLVFTIQLKRSSTSFKSFSHRSPLDIVNCFSYLKTIACMAQPKFVIFFLYIPVYFWGFFFFFFNFF